jgi:acetylornithine/succinyldiaminopimelate/putrescine aminotransferase/predicted amino acid dehydrogenase
MLLNEYRESLIEKFGLHLSPQSAKGNVITLSNGDKIYDYLAQYGALPFGHNPKFLKECAINFLSTDQINFVQPNIHPAASKLAETLTALVNSELYTRCVLTNSGAETVEAAIKLAKIKTRRKKILAVYKGFHGKTFSALSASGSHRFKMPNIHDDINYDYIEVGDSDGLHSKLASKEYAAFIIEPVLGEGGMITVSHEFLASAVKLCEETGTLSIFDEIQTGLGRLGDICVAKQLNIYPDCLLFSKALGGGLVPIGAMIYKEACYDLNFDKKHSSTFANNGYASTIATATLNGLMSDNKSALKHVKKLSQHVDKLKDTLLHKYSDILAVSGSGLMRAFTFYDALAKNNILVNFCQNSGSMAYIICGFLMKMHKVYVMPLLSQPCSIRFEPPLNISYEDVDKFFAAIEHVCLLIKNGRYDMLFGTMIEARGLPSVEKKYPVSFVPNVIMSDDESTNEGLIKGKKFAFFIHSTSRDDLIHSFPYAIKENYTTEQKIELADKIFEISRIDYSPDVAVKFSVNNDKNASSGMFIFSPLAPKDMMNLTQAQRLDLMLEYIQIAKDNDVELVGLGAYTSVISAGGMTLLPHLDDLLVTNGNSLTALSTVESIFSIIGDKKVADEYAVIVGARGSVGKVCVAGLAHRYGHLILVGRQGSEDKIKKDILPYLLESCLDTSNKISAGSFFDKLKRVLTTRHLDVGSMDIDDFYFELEKIGLSIDSDYEASFLKADVVVSATSEGKAFLSTDYLKRSAIVFDAARPFDFIANNDFTIYEGGLVTQPNTTYYSDCNMVKSPPGINLACLSETIALALDAAGDRVSLGKSVNYANASSILDIALSQGFTPVRYDTDKGEGKAHTLKEGGDTVAVLS